MKINHQPSRRFSTHERAGRQLAERRAQEVTVAARRNASEIMTRMPNVSCGNAH